jgi:hypothetical protein
MSNAKGKPRRKVPVNRKPLEFKEVMAKIKVPNPSPEAQRIEVAIRTVWPKVICDRYLLMEILAKLEIADRFLTELSCEENDFQATEIERLLDQAREGL